MAEEVVEEVEAVEHHLEPVPREPVLPQLEAEVAVEEHLVAGVE